MTDPDPYMDTVTPPSDEGVQAEFDDLGRRVKDGEDAKAERARRLRRLHRDDPERWSQTRLAAMAGISQAAVSKSIRRSPGEIGLEECTDPAYVAGRVLGIATQIAERFLLKDGVPNHSHPLRATADKMLEERQPITSATLGILRAKIAKAIESNVRPTHRHVATLFTNQLADCVEKLAQEMPPVVGDQARNQVWIGHDQQRALFLARMRAAKPAAN